MRKPVVSGTFYPSDRTTLEKEILSFLRSADDRIKARAIMVPHAGYVYSGAVAGAVYSSVHLPRRFILLGPNHTGHGKPLSIYPKTGWHTPLGVGSIDSELTQLLIANCPDLQEDSAAHAREHSLEVQVPFLQSLVPDMSFAAICIGTGEYPMLQTLGKSMATVIRMLAEPILMISSSDMNHYESAAKTREKDQYAIERIRAVDPEGLLHAVREHDISMCGFAPTVATLTACRELGSTEGILVRYANSGEINGDYDRVVGYAGMVVAE